MLQHYYTLITADHFNDLAGINRILNLAIRDRSITSKDFTYLSTVAKSLAFTFTTDFEFV